MDNEKTNLSEQNGEPEKVTKNSEADVQSVLEKTFNYDENTLNGELEKLAQTFRDELKKARESSEELADSAGELIQQLDDEAGVEHVDPDDLCRCCGERLRDRSVSENYEYCAECREAMRHYPIEIYRFVIAGAVIFAAVISVLCFIAEYSGFSDVRMARKDVKLNKRTSAVELYESAVDFFKDENSGTNFISLEAAKQLSHIMPNGLNSMNSIIEYTEDSLGKIGASLPINSSYVEMRASALRMSATLQAFTSVIGKEEYASFDGTDKDIYTAIMTEVGSLIDGTTLIPRLGSDESDSVKYDEGIVRFAQYMFAYSAGNSADAYKYLKLCEETSPEYVWLYAYDLAVIEAQIGNFDECERLSNLLSDLNADDVYSYIAKAFGERMQGNTDKALTLCDKALTLDESASEIYRQKAILYILKGEYENAVEAAKTGLSYEEFAALYYVYFVAAKEMGDSALVQELTEKIESSNIVFEGRIKDYADGKLTAQSLFTEGSGDIA